LQAGDVLAAFDRHARIVDAAARASVTCSDADDQIFIDLAVAHQAWLLSKDQAVLSMQKRLLAHGAHAQTAIEFIATAGP
ncbi:MAG: VapC toxin family PIN domain ribonuclease, partial [Pseudomonadota bacterium]